MALPGFQSLTRPLLVLLEGGEKRSVEQIRSALAEQFDLTKEDLEERLPSGSDEAVGEHCRLGSSRTWTARDV